MKKTIISILIISLMSFLLVGNSYAAQLQAKIEVSASSVEVSAGDKVTFTLKTNNIANAENDSVSAISGVLEWDENFFEIPSDGTGSVTLNTETGDFNCISIVKDGGTNGTIILKVKDSATGSGVVKFTNLEASDGRTDAEGTVTTPDQEITIKIKTTDPENPDTPTDPENPDTPTDPENPDTPTDPENPDTPTDPENPDTPTNPENPNDNNGINQEPGQNQPTTDGTTVTVGGDNTIANRDYDKAGLNTIIIVALTVMSAITIVIYKKNQKYRDIK